MQQWLAPRWAAFWFVLTTLVMTWPLAAGLSRDIPWDYGDSLLNCWILSWNSDHLLGALRGDVAGLGNLWHGNIFYPEPYALAYSELLIAQTIQGLPIYALTGNIILVYNLLFLSTFALSALGAYLFVRQLTGDNRAAFVAGLVYGFLPYRADQATHLHILSSQWMPFALYGLRRFFDTGRTRALLGGALAIIVQNLSCGYYLIYFALIIPPYVLWELVSRGRHRDWRTWLALATAGALVGACTVPFMTPYLALRALTGQGRALIEAGGFSADVLAYLTADENLRLWGGVLQTWPRPEGDLFPGLLLVGLAATGLVAALRRAWQDGTITARAFPGRPLVPERWNRPVVMGGLVVSALALGLALLVILGGPTRIEVGPVEIRYRGVWRALLTSMVAFGVALAVSTRVRAITAAAARSYEVWFVVLAAGLACLSLGPTPTWGGAPLRELGLYRWLYDVLPGLDGLRVPARFGMLAMLCLVVSAGSGAAVLLRRSRHAHVVTLVLAAGILAEGCAAPIPMNQMATYAEFGAPPDRVTPATDPPPVYAYLAALPRTSALVEFPIGETGWDIRSVYHAGMHRLPVVNGYSGGFPDRYVTLAGLLYNPYAQPDGAWAALRATGVTHAVVHQRAYQGSVFQNPADWLTSNGAREVASFPDARVYELPVR